MVKNDNYHCTNDLLNFYFQEVLFEAKESLRKNYSIPFAKLRNQDEFRDIL